MSRIYSLILIGFLMFPIPGYSQDIIPGGEEPAIVYFFRLPNFYGSAIRMKININDFPVVMLKNGAWFQYSLEPGDYSFSCRMTRESRIKLRLEPGEVYYVKAYLNQGFWSATPILEVVDSISGKAIIDGGGLRSMEFIELPLVRPKQRIGVTIGGGFGFEDIAMFVDEKGNDVNLSMGGGFAIGGEYGNEISRNFDFSVNLYYQGSSLRPYLNNATASFNRMAFTATPALIIPIKGGNFHRLRLGAGPGIYNFGGLKIDASKLGVSNIELKYNLAIGLHGLFVYESNFAERASMSMGLKYYNVKYEYNPQRSNRSISDPLILYLVMHTDFENSTTKDP